MTYVQNRKGVTDLENELMVTRGKYVMDMYTLLYLKWITNKDLLYSTGNCAQCYVASLDGKGVWERMDTCKCMAEALCCPPVTIMMLLISYTPIQNMAFKKEQGD